VRLGRTNFDDLVETSFLDALLAFSTGILLLFALADHLLRLLSFLAIFFALFFREKKFTTSALATNNLLTRYTS
jgi:hypothetical protein